MAGALVKVKVAQSCPTLCDPMVCPWNSPAQNTAAGCHSLLQGIFLTRESNWGLLHCRQILYHLSYQGNLANTLGKYQVEVDTFPLFALLPWIPPSFHFCLFLLLVSISPLLSSYLSSLWPHILHYALDWPQNSFGFFCQLLRKNLNELYRQPNISWFFFQFISRVLDFLIFKKCSGLPWWLSAEESACQCRRHRFNPSSGKIPHRACALEPGSHNHWSLEAWTLCSTTGETTTRSLHITTREWPLLTATRERSPCTKTPHSQKINF